MLRGKATETSPFLFLAGGAGMLRAKFGEKRHATGPAILCSQAEFCLGFLVREV